MARVESQLHRGGDLVDVLPAGTGGADEALLDLVVVESDAGGDADHDVRYFFASTLPSSTAGWSKASTPRSRAAMIVSSIKCISNSPRFRSSSLSISMLRTGQPCLASV